jgi:hypothetical protein
MIVSCITDCRKLKRTKMWLPLVADVHSKFNESSLTGSAFTTDADLQAR